MSTRNLTVNDTGVFLIPEFSATGEVSYRRTGRTEETDGERLTADFATRKEVDHVRLVQESRQIINRAYAVVEKNATPTAIGYFAAPEGELEIRETIAKLSIEADDFNTRALAAGSERRCRVAVYAVALVMDDERAAARLTETVRERLTYMLNALSKADRKAFDDVWPKSERLHKLASGIQADAVEMALTAAQRARKMITELSRDGFVAHEIAARLDLNPIESAISLFA